MDTNRIVTADEIIEQLRKGEVVLCSECKSGTCKTNAIDITMSKEFVCDQCGSVIRI